MTESKQGAVLRIITSTMAAVKDPTNADKAQAVANEITQALIGLNGAHAFALGAALARGGLASGSPDEVLLMIAVADEIGDKIASVKHTDDRTLH